MEDSYTVHRRRKAAARKREKTPEPPRRRDEESGDDDTLARSKMERMVEDTEKMAKIRGGEDTGRKISTGDDIVAVKSAGDEEGEPTVKDDENRIEPVVAATAEVKTVKITSPNSEETDEYKRVKDSVAVADVKPRDSDVAVSKTAGNAGDEKNRRGGSPVETISPVISGHRPETSSVKTGESSRTKRRTKERLSAERNRGYGTDSSDGNDMVPVPVRRKKSPDVPRPKIYAAKSQTRTRAAASNDTEDDRNASNNESGACRSTREKRQVGKRYSTGTEDEIGAKIDGKIVDKRGGTQADSGTSEKRSTSRHRCPSDTDEDFAPEMIKKSETFPQKSSDRQAIRRSASEIKKQIIPLNDDSLIQDFARAQEDYLRRERGIMAPDFDDDEDNNRTAKISDSKILRKRKLAVLHSDPGEIVKSRDRQAAVVGPDEKKSWFSWVTTSFGKKKKKDKDKEKTDEYSADDRVAVLRARGDRVSLMEFLKALQEIVSEFRAYVAQNPREIAALRRSRNRCIGELILVIIYCGLGAFVFRFTEGAFETFYKCGVKRVKRDFLDNLWNYSHNMREEDWKSMARRKLMEFEEQLHNAHEAGVHSYSGQKSWTFLNAVSYCITVITTIGYGHISPKTLAGRAITIVYAIFGIPIFLIILADFGKLFTRGIKFLWAFVRRLYYTGSCRKVRRTGPVQEVMKGVQLVYDFATFRRPSQLNQEEVEEMQRQQIHAETVLNLDGNAPETPGTPAMSNFAIDDEFNLPISVAISILLGYIFVGATAYHMFEEDWDFFESFYFVFISMSTIGFGDFVPENPFFMMFSIVYLVFGLALTSMCINVVQTVLSDSFKQASQKISATIGFEVPPEEGEEGFQPEGGEEVEAATSDVQITVKEEEAREQIAPKAKQEDVDV